MTLFSFIKSQLSISQVIEEYITLKQAGSYLKGTCPFHSEKDASFTVSPERGMFYCFGCHAGGDLIAFIAKKENISQIEAALHLVDYYNLSVPENIQKEQVGLSISEKQTYHKLCSAIEEWSHRQLFNNHAPFIYLTENRMINESMLKSFKLGYMPGGLRAINSFIKDMNRENILLKDLIDSGFIIQNNSTCYSPFEERILFPIKDSIGRTCGFGGRVYRLHDERAKYYNSKDSPHFQKGSLLFGLDNAKETMRLSNEAILVEGYLDCIAMAQAGNSNAVATLGTACTKEHLVMLGRYASKIYVLYDGDKAGKQAVMRLAELSWETNVELNIISLPSQEDPASFLQKGNNIETIKSESQDVFSFFLEAQGDAFFSKSLPEKIAISDRIVKMIAEIKEPLKQDLLLQQASSVLSIPFSSLQTACRTAKNKESLKEDDEAERLLEENKEEAMNALEKKILCAILTDTTHATEVIIEKDLLPYFSKRALFLLEKYIDIANLYSKQERFNVLYESLDEKNREWLSNISMALEEKPSPIMLQEYLRLFRKQKWKIALQDMKRHMIEAQKRGDFEMVKKLGENFLKLKYEMKSRGLI